MSAKLKIEPSVRAPASLCWRCGYMSDAASGVTGDRVPEEGDATLCVRCGEWSIFEEGLTQRKPTDAEFLEIGESKNARALRATWIRTFPGEHRYWSGRR